jgi:hypothetical protein
MSWWAVKGLLPEWCREWFKYSNGI